MESFCFVPIKRLKIEHARKLLFKKIRFWNFPSVIFTGNNIEKKVVNYVTNKGKIYKIYISNIYEF